MDINMLKEYAVETGETSTLYKVPAGAMGNDTGVDIEVIIPNNIDNVTGLYGQIDSNAKVTWDGIESTLLNNNESAIAVRLSECTGNIYSSDARAETAELNLKILDVVSNITGVNEAQVVGSSNGSAIAIETAAASALSSGEYNVKVTGAAYVDYKGDQEIDFTSSFEAMKKAGVTLTGITDSTYNLNSGTGRVVSTYSKLGGNAESYLYGGSGYSHDSKCEQGTLGYMGLENSYEFSEHRTYNNGEETIEDYSSSTIALSKNKETVEDIPEIDVEESDKEIDKESENKDENQKDNTTDEENDKTDNPPVINGNNSSSTIVTVDYQFIDSAMHVLRNAIKNTSILTATKIDTNTSGLQTINAANGVYNRYVSNSKDFLSTLNIVCGNIILTADSWRELDQVLATDISGGLNKLSSVSLTSLDKFYSNLPEIDSTSLMTSSTGNIKITVSELFEACSDSNILMSSLLQDISDTQNIKYKLDSFIDESQSRLTGESFDVARDKLEEFSLTCAKKIEYANKLMESMQTAYKKLIEYLQKYDLAEADTSKIPEFETTKKEMEQQRDSLITRIAVLESENGKWVCDAYGTMYDGAYGCVSSHQIDNTALIAACNKQLDNCNTIITELSNILECLYALPQQDNSAATGIINESQTNKDLMQKPTVNQNPVVNQNSQINTIPPINQNISGSQTTTNNKKNEENIVQNTDNNNQNNKLETPTTNNKVVSNSQNNQPTNTINSNVSNNKPIINENKESINNQETQTIPNENNNIINNQENIIEDNNQNKVPENKSETPTLESNPNIQAQSNSSIDNDKNNKNIFSTIGGVAAVSGAIGAASYGIKQYINKKKNQKEEYSKEEDDLENFDE